MLNWTKYGMKWAGVFYALVLVSGCTTSAQKMLTHDDQTMMDIWQQQTGGGQSGSRAQELMDARQVLRRPITDNDLMPLAQDQMSYTRTAQNEIYSQFHRLPNPDLVMYVFPHLAGSDPVPVPGYSTVFPLYQKVQYAMPGERVEPY